jgi:hypothetical protein
MTLTTGLAPLEGLGIVYFRIIEIFSHASRSEWRRELEGCSAGRVPFPAARLSAL